MRTLLIILRAGHPALRTDMVTGRKIVAAFALIAPACSYIPGTDANLIAKAEDTIIAMAADQDEVKFQNTFATEHFVCGEIDPAAQTMSEWEPFAYSLASRTLIIMPHPTPGNLSLRSRMASFPRECSTAGSLAAARRRMYESSLPPRARAGAG